MATTTPMYGPDGHVRLVPQDQVDWATKNGGTPAYHMKTPSGPRWIPKDKVNWAIDNKATFFDDAEAKRYGWKPIAATPAASPAAAKPAAPPPAAPPAAPAPAPPPPAPKKPTPAAVPVAGRPAGGTPAPRQVTSGGFPTGAPPIQGFEWPGSPRQPQAAPQITPPPPPSTGGYIAPETPLPPERGQALPSLMPTPPRRMSPAEEALAASGDVGYRLDRKGKAPTTFGELFEETRRGGPEHELTPYNISLEAPATPRELGLRTSMKKMSKSDEKLARYKEQALYDTGLTKPVEGPDRYIRPDDSPEAQKQKREAYGRLAQSMLQQRQAIVNANSVDEVNAAVNHEVHSPVIRGLQTMRDLNAAPLFTADDIPFGVRLGVANGLRLQYGVNVTDPQMRGLLNATGGFFSPENLEMMYALSPIGGETGIGGKAGVAAGTGVSVPFAYQGINGAYQQLKAAQALKQQGKGDEASQQYTEAMINAIMGATAAVHAVHGAYHPIRGFVKDPLSIVMPVDENMATAYRMRRAAERHADETRAPEISQPELVGPREWEPEHGRRIEQIGSLVGQAARQGTRAGQVSVVPPGERDIYGPAIEDIAAQVAKAATTGRGGERGAEVSPGGPTATEYEPGIERIGTLVGQAAARGTMPDLEGVVRAGAEARMMSPEEMAEDVRKKHPSRRTPEEKAWLANYSRWKGEAIEPPPKPAPKPAAAQSPRRAQFDQQAQEITAKLPPVQPGYTRLWRGNRPDEVGKNPQFTNDLAGIALPFQQGYGGPITYVDVPTADLGKYEAGAGAAPGAEFMLPPELASQARDVNEEDYLRTQGITEPAAAAPAAPAAASAPAKGLEPAPTPTAQPPAAPAPAEPATGHEPAAPASPAKATTAEPAATPAAPAGLTSPDGRQAHELPYHEFRKLPGALPTRGLIPILTLKDYTRDTLAPFKIDDLKVAAKMMGVAISGSKNEIIGRLVDRWNLRKELAQHTVETLRKKSNAELKAMAKRAGIYSGGNKEALAGGLAQWPEAERNRAKGMLIEDHHRQLVQKAFDAGKMVPDENLQRYGLGKYAGQSPQRVAARQILEQRGALKLLSPEQQARYDELDNLIRDTKDVEQKRKYIVEQIGLERTAQELWRAQQAGAKPGALEPAPAPTATAAPTPTPITEPTPTQAEPLGRSRSIGSPEAPLLYGTGTHVYFKDGQWYYRAADPKQRMGGWYKASSGMAEDLNNAVKENRLKPTLPGSATTTEPATEPTTPPAEPAGGKKGGKKAKPAIAEPPKPGGTRANLTAEVPKEGKNYAGRYVQAALAPVKAAWDRLTKDLPEVMYSKAATYKGRKTIEAYIHGEGDRPLRKLLLEEDRGGDGTLKGYRIKMEDYHTPKGESVPVSVSQELGYAKDLKTAKAIASSRLRAGDLHDPSKPVLTGMNREVQGYKHPIKPSRPAQFPQDRLVIQVPGDGTFDIPNTPYAVENAIAKGAKFEPEGPEAVGAEPPKAPKKFDVNKYIKELEDQEEELKQKVKATYGHTGNQSWQEQLEAVQEELRRARAGELEEPAEPKKGKQKEALEAAPSPSAGPTQTHAETTYPYTNIPGQPTQAPRAQQGSARPRPAQTGTTRNYTVAELAQLGGPTPPDGKSPLRVKFDTTMESGRASLRWVKNTVAPEFMDKDARVAGIWRKASLGEIANRMAMYRRRFDDARWELHRLGPEVQRGFMKAAETGGRFSDNPALQQLADDWFAIQKPLWEEIQKRTGIARAYEHFMPHLWQDPAAAQRFYAGLGLRQLEGTKTFRHARELPTIQDGLDAGLKLISDDPVELMLRKLHEMTRFVVEHDEFEKYMNSGYARYSPGATTRFNIPDDWVEAPAPWGKKYAREKRDITEVVDMPLFMALNDFARSLGIDHYREQPMSDGVIGYAQPGINKVVTKIATPLNTLTHEIGHIIDLKHGPNGVALHKIMGRDPVMRKELADLAEQRIVGEQNISPSHMKYIKSGPEKLANLFDFLIHNPTVGERIAPKSMKFVRDHLNSDPRLKPLLDIEPTATRRGLTHELEAGPPQVMGRWFIPKSMNEVIGRTTSSSLFQKMPPFEAWRKASNALVMSRLSASGRHALFTGFEVAMSAFGKGLRQIVRGRPVEGLGNIARALPTPYAAFDLGKALVTGRRAIKEAYGDGLAGLEMTKHMEQLSMAGGRTHMDPWYATGSWNEVKKQWAKGEILKSFLHPFRNYAALVELTSKPVMDMWVPYLKQAVFRDNVGEELLAHPHQLAHVFEHGHHYFEGLGDASREYAKEVAEAHFNGDPIPDAPRGVHKKAEERIKEKVPQIIELSRQTHEAGVMQKVWDSVDNRMGQLVYDNLFWSRTLKELGQASLQSLGWNLGSWREVGGGLIDGAKMIQDIRAGRRPDVSMKMSYLAAYPMVMGMMGLLTQYAYTGKLPQSGKNPWETTKNWLLDAFFPHNGKGDERISLPGYHIDAYKYARDFQWGPIEGIKGAVTEATAKQNPLFSTLAAMLNNRDFYDRQVYDPEDPLYKQLLEATQYSLESLLPYSFTNAQRLTQTTGERPTAQQYIESFFGINRAPATLGQTTAQHLLGQYAKENRKYGAMPMEAWQHQQMRRQLAARLKDKDYSAVAAAMKGIGEGKLKPKDWVTISTMAETPWDEHVFAQSYVTLPEALHVYEAATPEERRRFQPLLAKKVGQLQGVDPKDPLYKRFMDAVSDTSYMHGGISTPMTSLQPPPAP